MLCYRAALWLNVFFFSIGQAVAACDMTISTNSLDALEELKPFDHVCSHILLSERDRLPINNNSISNIVCEIFSDSFSNCLANVVHLQPGAFRIIATATHQDFRVMAAYNSNRLDPHAGVRLCDAVSQFCASRLSGHSLKYANDLIVQILAMDPGRLSFEGRFAVSHGIPKDWLQSSLQLGYYVVDGPIAWVYHDNFSDCVDAREVDPKWGPLIHEAEARAWNGFTGNARSYYARVKRLLKEEYGFDWLSPMDLNPDRHIHLAWPTGTNRPGNP